MAKFDPTTFTTSLADGLISDVGCDPGILSRILSDESLKNGLLALRGEIEFGLGEIALAADALALAIRQERLERTITSRTASLSALVPGWGEKLREIRAAVLAAGRGYRA